MTGQARTPEHGLARALPDRARQAVPARSAASGRRAALDVPPRARLRPTAPSCRAHAPTAVSASRWEAIRSAPWHERQRDRTTLDPVAVGQVGGRRGGWHLRVEHGNSETDAEHHDRHTSGIQDAAPGIEHRTRHPAPSTQHRTQHPAPCTLHLLHLDPHAVVLVPEISGWIPVRHRRLDVAVRIGGAREDQVRRRPFGRRSANSKRRQV